MEVKLDLHGSLAALNASPGYGAGVLEIMLDTDTIWL